MLGKLLKYDIKREFKSLIPMYGIVIILPLVIRIMTFIKEKVAAFSFIANIILVVYVVALVGLFFLTFFNSIRNFLNNVLKDEGYLTHTLPVKKSSIIISKEITAMITITVSVVMIILSLFLAFYDGTPLSVLFEPIHYFAEQFAIFYGMGNIEFYIFWILFIVISYISYIVTFHLALLLGHTRNENKIVFSIVFGIIIYLALQVVSMLGLGLNILIKPEIMDALGSTTNSMEDLAILGESMQFVLYTQLIISIITPIVIHFISCNVLKKKLNLE